MKPDYKNWIPKGLMVTLIAACAVLSLLAGFLFGLTLATGAWYMIVVSVAVICGTVALIWFTIKYSDMRAAFSYDGEIRLSARIIEKTAERVILPKGGKGLDVGCGSGALAIACAKNNPEAEIVGMDRWGKEYASFSKNLCEKNAAAEGVGNVTFTQGDALALPFDDQTFDAVFSNYCYHNIPSKDRQSILKETFRVLKKGGTFAIHDIFTVQKYGDMQAFLEELKREGFESAELIDTTKGAYLSEVEAKKYMLGGSKLLIGKK